MLGVLDGSKSYDLPNLSEVGRTRGSAGSRVDLREAVARDECLSGAGTGGDTWYILTQ